jgi:hypothetical protein
LTEDIIDLMVQNLPENRPWKRNLKSNGAKHFRDRFEKINLGGPPTSTSENNLKVKGREAFHFEEISPGNPGIQPGERNLTVKGRKALQIRLRGNHREQAYD